MSQMPAPRRSLLRSSLAQPRRVRRRGEIILELVLVMPLLIISFVASLEFGVLALVLNTATHAVVDGAHEGALVFPASLPYDDGDPDPTGDDDIADAVALHMNEILAVVGLEIMPDGVANDNPNLANAYVQIVRATVLAERGELTIAPHCMQLGDPPAANETVVTLCFPLVSGAPVGRPVPDWLAPFGFSLSMSYFNATSRSLRE
jgi:hypothetical protein